MCAIEPIARWSLSMMFVDLRRARIREFLLSSTVVTSWKKFASWGDKQFCWFVIYYSSEYIVNVAYISHVCHRNLSQQLTAKRFWGLLVHKYARKMPRFSLLLSTFLCIRNFGVYVGVRTCVFLFFFLLLLLLCSSCQGLINDLLSFFLFSLQFIYEFNRVLLQRLAGATTEFRATQGQHMQIG